MGNCVEADAQGNYEDDGIYGEDGELIAMVNQQFFTVCDCSVAGANGFCNSLGRHTVRRNMSQ